MISLDSKYGDVKIFAKSFEEEAIGQVLQFANSPLGEGAHVRMMPDMHVGKGCTIGTTSYIKDKVCPNVIGLDIGCGVDLIRVDFDFASNMQKLDDAIRKVVPFGFNVHSVQQDPKEFFERMFCWKDIDDKAKQTALRARGSLGGGNHFIEAYNGGWLAVHSGSRNIGLKVALHYQKLAEQNMGGKFDGLAYLTGIDMEHYLHDMDVMQLFAQRNRESILLDIILEVANKWYWSWDDAISSVHNYIDIENRILRKGAVSAREGQRLVIPLNMRDGLLICEGKGNEDWNYSAPHGAGRLYSRSRAKKEIPMEDYRKSMEGIYTTCVNEATLDEAPFAYKDMDEIIEAIEPTVEVKERLIPIYNFKAS